jgi:multidrug transporter EmrE-like cation transporter
MSAKNPQFAVLLLVYTIISTLGLFKIKQSALVLSTDFAIGFVLYVLGFLLWMYMLRLFELSIAFPIAAGALILATQLASYAFLGEPASFFRVGGCALIIAGISLIYFDIGK